MKNSSPDIQKASRYITNRFSDDNNVMAILLVGSAARDAMDELSDIDFYVLLSKQGKYPAQEQIDNVAEHQIEILYDTLDGINSHLQNEDKALYRNVSSMLNDGLVIYTRNYELTASLQKLAKQNLASKLELSKATKSQYLSSASNFLSDMQRSLNGNDSVSFLLNSKQCLDSLMPLVAASAGTYLSKPSLLARYLHDHAPDLHKALQQLSVSTTDENKLENLKRIYSLVE